MQQVAFELKLAQVIVCFSFGADVRCNLQHSDIYCRPGHSAARQECRECCHSQPSRNLWFPGPGSRESCLQVYRSSSPACLLAIKFMWMFSIHLTTQPQSENRFYLTLAGQAHRRHRPSASDQDTVPTKAHEQPMEELDSWLQYTGQTRCFLGRCKHRGPHSSRTWQTKAATASAAAAEPSGTGQWG